MNMFQSARVWAIWYQPPPSQSMFKPYLPQILVTVLFPGTFKELVHLSLEGIVCTVLWLQLCCSHSINQATDPRWPLHGAWCISTLHISDSVFMGALSSWVPSTWYHIKLKLLAFPSESPRFTHFTFCWVFHLLPLAGSYGLWLTSSHYSPFSKNPIPIWAFCILIPSVGLLRSEPQLFDELFNLGLTTIASLNHLLFPPSVAYSPPTPRPRQPCVLFA